ncbi:dentin sialophosphoprotein isoform X2 [Dicentrarchus labrax]|uniref:dentin sialophosphoprotein isoform X2 n=1 Tax=Dicentrarchus labrax TaxID=13489 RepID=UPI0021F52E0B|nr:dentin sialophosphoprotein isoform X2 [Dicentrarchus labrax]
MAPSQVSNIKMKNLLFGVILGLLAAVHSTPVNTVTHDDVYREAVTDGFLIANPSLSSLTTESPKRNATVQATQQPSSESKESDIPEGNGDSSDMTSMFLQHGGEQYATTASSVLHAQSSIATVLPRDTDDSSSDSSTIQSPQPGFMSSSVPNEVNPKESDIWEGSGLGDTNDKTTTTVSPRHMEESSSDSSTIQSPQPGFMSSSVPNEVQSKESDIWESSGLGETDDKTTTTVSPRHMEESSSDSSTIQSPQPGFMSSSVPNEVQPKESDIWESSGSGETSNKTTTTVSPRHMEESSSDSSTIQSPQPGFMSSSVPNEVQPKESDIWESSGSGETSDKTTTTVSPRHMEKSSSDSSTDMKRSRSSRLDLLQPNIDVDKLNVVPTSAMHKGHTTPGWIIIVGFIVGVAALVMLFVAIATRDKWNAPSQAPQLETKTNSANQQRELEMETFLHKEKPRENGKAAEYTVIPVDELSEKYPSH